MSWAHPPGLGPSRLARLGLRLTQGPNRAEVDVFHLQDLSSGRNVALPAHSHKGMEFPRFVLRPNQPSVLLSAVRWLENNDERPEVLQD